MATTESYNTDQEYLIAGDRQSGKESKRAKKKDDDRWVKWVDTNIVEHPMTTEYHPQMGLAKNFYKGEQFKAIDPRTGEIFFFLTLAMR